MNNSNLYPGVSFTVPKGGTYRGEWIDRLGSNIIDENLDILVFSTQACLFSIQETNVFSDTPSDLLAAESVAANIIFDSPILRPSKRFYRFVVVNVSASETATVTARWIRRSQFIPKITESEEQEVSVTNEELGVRVVNEELGVNVANEEIEITPFSGVASGGTSDSLYDDSRFMDADILRDGIIKFKIGDFTYFKKVLGNTYNSIMFSSLFSGGFAHAVVGEPEYTHIVVGCVDAGELGNSYTVSFIESAEETADLSVSFTEGALVVSLGRTSGILDPDKNKAADIVNAIETIPEFYAQYYGDNEPMVATSEPIRFSGGEEAIVVSAGTKYTVLL